MYENQVKKFKQKKNYINNNNRINLRICDALWHRYVKWLIDHFAFSPPSSAISKIIYLNEELQKKKREITKQTLILLMSQNAMYLMVFIVANN